MASLQTPKPNWRLSIWFKPALAESQQQQRALMIDGLSNEKLLLTWSIVFARAGGFEIFFPQNRQSF